MHENRQKMNSHRRNFGAPGEPCETENEPNGCTKSVIIAFRETEITDTQNGDESAGCTKSLKNTLAERPNRHKNTPRAFSVARRRRREHHKGTHKTSRSKSKYSNPTSGHLQMKILIRPLDTQTMKLLIRPLDT